MRKISSSQCSELNELRNALEQTKWNKTKTAEVLQWSRMTIYRKIMQYDLRPPEQLPTPSVESSNPADC
jgi:transcriptional regulator of acetoin/glycerol metabolism